MSNDLFNFSRAIATIIKPTPTHCMGKTSSARKIQAISTATGSSTELNIVPIPIPVLGIPKVKQIVGNTAPKIAMAKEIPASPSNKTPETKKVGGNMMKIIINPPVTINGLLSQGVISVETLPLTYIYPANVKAEQKIGRAHV